MLEELKGIQAARKVKPAIKGNLEKLIEIGSQLERKIEEPAHYSYLDTEQYKKIYERVKDADIEYDKKDIQDLAVALSSQEPQNPKIRGVYIGALVSLLTEKNNKKGKRTIVELDLKGSEFPYLCAGAKYADVLMIKNVKGDCIGEGIAYNRGQAGIVILQDIIGEYAGWNIAKNHGQAGIVILQNIIGNDAGNWMADNHGQVGIVILQDIIGNYAGRYMATDHGQAGIVILQDIRGDNTGFGIAFNHGQASAISLKNISPNYLGNHYNCSLLDNEGKYFSQIRRFADEMIKKYSESRMTFEELREEIGRFTKRIKSGGENV